MPFIHLMRVSSEWIKRCVMQEQLYEPDQPGLGVDPDFRPTSGNKIHHTLEDAPTAAISRIVQILKHMDEYFAESPNKPTKSAFERVHDQRAGGDGLSLTKTFMTRYLPIFDKACPRWRELGRTEIRGKRGRGHITASTPSSAQRVKVTQQSQETTKRSTITPSTASDSEMRSTFPTLAMATEVTSPPFSPTPGARATVNEKSPPVASISLETQSHDDNVHEDSTAWEESNDEAHVEGGGPELSRAPLLQLQPEPDPERGRAISLTAASVIATQPATIESPDGAATATEEPAGLSSSTPRMLPGRKRKRQNTDRSFQNGREEDVTGIPSLGRHQEVGEDYPEERELELYVEDMTASVSMLLSPPILLLQR